MTLTLPWMVVGLVVYREGFLRRHGVYEGNRHDITTVQGIVDKLRAGVKDKGRSPTIVVDRGMASEGNLKEIKEKGMRYRVAARHAERDKYLEEFDGIPIKEIETKETNGILQFEWKRKADITNAPSGNHCASRCGRH